MTILEILKEEGIELPSELSTYQLQIGEWVDWYKGKHAAFHNYKVTRADGSLGEKTRRSLRMGKTVAEDWASMLLTEKTLINVSDEKAQRWLTGDAQEQETGILGKNSFWTECSSLIEEAFAKGTAAIVVGLRNAKMMNGILSEADIYLHYIKNPQMIIPLRWRNRQVIDCLFVSVEQKDKDTHYLVQTHKELPDGRYSIEHAHYITSKGSKTHTKETVDVAKNFVSPCKLFFLVRPNLNNNFTESLPLGASVYGNAIEQLQGVDLTYDNFCADFELGRKKVFMKQDLFSIGTDGKPSVGDTIEQSLFVSIGETRPDEKMSGLPIQEFNPVLRVDENDKAIQLFLNLLSMKCGMGRNFYRFEDGRVYTNIQQVKSSNKELMNSIAKHRSLITKVLTELTQSLLTIGKAVGQVNSEGAKITITFDDSIFLDDETERARFLNEIREGVRQKWEYRVRFLGEDEETAKRMTSADSPVEEEGEVGAIFDA